MAFYGSSLPCGVTLWGNVTFLPPRAAWVDVFLLFFRRGTGPKRSGAVLACFWTDFQPEPSILEPIRTVFDDFGPSRHFGRDLARPGTGREALRPAQGLAGRPWSSPYFFSVKKTTCFLFSEGGWLPPSENKKARHFFIQRGSDPRLAFLALEKKIWGGPGPPSQSVAWSLSLIHI